MTQVARLTANIQADIAGFQSNLNRARSDLARTEGNLKTSLAKMDRNFAGLGKSMQRVTDIGRQMGSALAKVGIGVGIGSLARDMLDAGLRFDRLNTQLKFVTGSSAGAAREMEYLRGVANTLGLDFNATAESFAKFAAAAKGTALEGRGVREIFEAVAKAATAMQLSAQDTEGVFLALGQMIGKGTVQAEELRGQLGERLPGAFQIAARAMGMTTAELGKMLESGEVIAEDFLPKFAVEMEKTFGSTAVEAASSTTAQINRAKNAWEELKIAVVTSDAVVNVIENTTQGVKESADQIDGMADAFRRAKQAASELALTTRLIMLDDVRNRLTQAESDFAAGAIAQRHLDAVRADYDRIRDSVSALRGEIVGLAADAQKVPADPWLAGALNPATKGQPAPAAAAPSAAAGGGSRTIARDVDQVAQRIANLQFQLAQLGRTPIDQAIAANLQNIKPTPEQAAQIADLTRQIEQLKAAAMTEDAETASIDALIAETAARWEERVAQGQRLTEEVMTPMETYNERLRELNVALATGTISQETFNRQVAAADQAFAAATQGSTEFRDTARDAAGILFAGLSDAVIEARSLDEALQGVIKSLAKMALNKVLGMGLDLIFGGFGFPGLATGGPGGGLTLVGERGPELVNLPMGSYVNPASRSSGMMRQMMSASEIGAPGSVVINAPITVNGSAGTPQQNTDLAEKMAREFERSARQLVKDELGNQQRLGGLSNPFAAGYQRGM